MTSFGGSLAGVWRRVAPFALCNLPHWCAKPICDLPTAILLPCTIALIFIAMAAQMMRHILIDRVRKEQAAKRGGRAITLSLDQHLSDHAPETNFDLLVLDHAMKELALLDARQCKVLELRFFDEISIEDTAEVFEISQATAKREWATTRVWLHRTLSKGAIVP